MLATATLLIIFVPPTVFRRSYLDQTLNVAAAPWSSSPGHLLFPYMDPKWYYFIRERDLRCSRPDKTESASSLFRAFCVSHRYKRSISPHTPLANNFEGDKQRNSTYYRVTIQCCARLRRFCPPTIGTEAACGRATRPSRNKCKIKGE